jgi:malonyl CoA-acyl carrier protein transacylase
VRTKFDIYVLFQGQQAQLQNMLEQTSETRKMNEVDSQEKVKQMEMKKQHDNNIVSQLKIIVAEKEAKVHTLEDEIRQLKLKK